jgi:anti-sigma factor RsiW
MSEDMACREIVELLSDYLEDALSEDVRAHVDSHLAGCDGCTSALDQFRRTIAATGRLTEDALTEDQRGTILAAFRHHVNG